MSPNFLFVNVTCLDTIFNFQKAIYFFGLGQTVIIVKQILFQTVKETIYLGNNCKVKQIINQNLCESGTKYCFSHTKVPKLDIEIT